jgi:transposase
LSRRVLPPIPAGLSVVQVLPTPDRVTIITAPTPSQSACPLCGGLSGRAHSHYTRTLADLPWSGRVVAVQVRARRFRCATADCPRRVFTERLPEVARPGARRSERLADVQRHLGLALGGAAGSRLADKLAMPVSGATLLRLVAGTELPAPPAPRVVGLDEWARRRGLTYGTILCDLERRTIVDLLPDRSAETVAAWLRRHPSVRVIARDRASVFGRGIREGAPSAAASGRGHRGLSRSAAAGTSRATSATRSVPRSAATARRSRRRLPPPSRPMDRRTRRRGRSGPRARLWRPCAGSAVTSGGRATRRSAGCTRTACRRA